MKFRPVLKSFSIASEASVAKKSPPDLPDETPLGITVLHPKNGNDEKALVDIITIHGLSGHPRKTWTNSKTGHYWPVKSLPQDIPLSRIMTFGYSTNTSPLNNNTAIISDIARSLLSHLINKRQTEKQKARPMIFIAHSLGGIVLKEFLHVASNARNDDMASCVCGILFLGTPHKGSDLASFLNVLNTVVKSIFRRPPDAILQDLSTNSRHLLELDQLLRFRLGKIDIYSFYELQPMGSMKTPVVEKHSALLNLPSEIEQIGLDANHRQMCKPVDRNDFIYETIAQRIIDIMNRQIDKAQFSNELLQMTNKFAVRQLEQISLLAGFQSHQQPSGSFPAILMASFSETKGTDLPIEPNALVDVLRDLPPPKAKEYLGSLRKLLARAESLNKMLRFVELQREQLKSEAAKLDFDTQQKADKQKIADLTAENELLKDKLRTAKHAADTPAILAVSREIAYARRSPRDSCETETMADEYPETPHESQYEDALENYDLDDEWRESQKIYEEAYHAAVPVAAAYAVAVEDVRSTRQKGRTSEDSSRSIDYQSRDIVQAEADRHYRESVIARRIASDESCYSERSVVDKWLDDEAQYIPIVIPSETGEHKKGHTDGILDGPDADVVIEHKTFAHEDIEVPVFQSEHLPPEGERPVLNIVYPTPVPSRGPSPSPPEQETTKEVKPEPSNPDVDDLEFAATLAAGLADTGFDPDLVVNDPSYTRRESSLGMQNDMDGHTVYQLPLAEDVTSTLDDEAETGVNQPEPEEEWATPKTSKKSKKKSKRQSLSSEPDANIDSPEEMSVHEFDNGVKIQADSTEKKPKSNEEGLVKTRMESESILNSLRIALTHGEELFESLEIANASASGRASLKGSDEESEYSNEEEGNDEDDHRQGYKR